LKVGFKTDTGRCRQVNEDTIIANEELGLFVVADGMGGHKAGKVASRIAVDEIQRFISKGMEEADNPKTLLDESLLAANKAIVSSSVEDPDRKSNMGTTVVVALFYGDRLLISHVGDSRAYRINDRTIQQITQDHSFVAGWVREGRLSPEDARIHPARHGLSMALGQEDAIILETTEWSWEDFGCLLLCSDGLTEMLEDHEILDIVDGSAGPQEACDSLVEKANENGGEDNISLIIIC
jgi:serine/threonine protein phosphatase PrpC